MSRAPLVVAGTIAGAAAVLAFPTHSSHLTLPSAGGSGTPASGATATAGGSSSSSGSSSSGAATPQATSGSATRTATGADESYRFGDLAATVTVEGRKITNVGIATLNETDGRSAAIDSYAIPQLEKQVIDAGSTSVNGVSGATFTSQAFVDSVASALGKLGIQP